MAPLHATRGLKSSPDRAGCAVVLYICLQLQQHARTRDVPQVMLDMYRATIETRDRDP